jgi:phosphate/sulfate permease
MSFLAAFSIGSNDAANGLGTSYGTKAVPLWFILVNGAAAEFVGAMFCSDKVSATLSSGIIKNLEKNTTTDPPNEITMASKQRMMFSATTATFAFIILASFTGMPISGTHTIVSALYGTGLIGSSVDEMTWTGKHGMTGILLGWVISPFCSMVVAFFLMFLVSSCSMNTKTISYKCRLYGTCVVLALTCGMLAIILDVQFNKKY